jgi:hypothetical protein
VAFRKQKSFRPFGDQSGNIVLNWLEELKTGARETI